MNPSRPFEDFLRGEFLKQYDGNPDDDPDSFDVWVTDMDVDELIALGDRAMNRLSNELKNNR